MTEKKYRPAEEFIELSRKYIGKSQTGGWYGAYGHGSVYDRDGATRLAIERFSCALGDENPMYYDGAYAANSKYGCIIAPPTFLLMVGYPGHHGAMPDLDDTVENKYNLANFISAIQWEWNDVIRVGTKFKTELKLADIYEKKGSDGRTLYFFITKGPYRDLRGNLIGTGEGTLIFVRSEKDVQNAPMYNREVYKYSKEELDEIKHAYLNEERRGAKPRYWDDVNVGDQLPTIVKGPIHLPEFCNWRMVFGGPRPFGLGWRDLQKTKGAGSPNPVTGWEVHSCYDHEDSIAAKNRGMPLLFGQGGMGFSLPEHVLVNWMGDDGFLRRMKTQLRKPFFYGDTAYYRCKVVKKYKDVVKDKEYNAVDIEMTVLNERKENFMPGTATIYLPNPGKEVDLPVPA